MRFSIRKKHTAPAVIIVALIDVLIVLVIFLLVTTTFKQVPSLKLTLPASRQALKPGVNDNPPTVVTISSNLAGSMSITTPLSATSPTRSDAHRERLR